EFQAPRLCVGGSVSLIYSISDNCSQDSVNSTFTITPTPTVTFTCGSDKTVPACSTQAQVNAAWTSFLNSTTASGGCGNGTLTNNAPANAPSACGGYVDVTWTYNVTGCGQSQACTKRFTVTATPQVVFECGSDKTVPACSTQAQVNAAWTSFLASTTASGGCGIGTLTNNAPANAPSACGGYVDVTWIYNASNPCGQTEGCQGQFKTFTIGGWGTSCNGGNPGCYRDSNFTAAFPNGLAIGCGNNKLSFTSSSAIQNYLPAGGPAAVLTTGAVNPTTSKGVLSSQLIALTLSLGFDAYDSNFSTSSSSLGSLTIKSGTFAGMTVSSFLQLANNIIGGCSSQYSVSDINAVATAINENFDNGNTDLQFLNCSGGQTPQGSTYSCTKRFTVTAPAPVVITCGPDVILPACSTQAQLTAAWNSFLSSTTASGGCNGVLTRTSCTAPSLCGGYVDVTWTYTVSGCGQQSGCGSTNSVHCTKRFTVAAPAPVTLTCGSNFVLPACSTQAQLTAAWNSFLSSTTATGGCGGVLTRTQCSPPSLCGGYVDVTWTYTVGSCGQQSGCGSTNSQSCTRRFTVAAPSPVSFRCGTDITVPACSTQAQITTAWNSFLASTTASGGCGGVLTRTSATVPPSCGGYVDVTWTYTVASCGQQSGCGTGNSLTCTKRFTVAATAPVVFNCGTDKIVPACSTQAQVTAAWNSFLTSTTASGGCNGVLTRSTCTAPSACGGYVDVTWTYTTTACGGQASTQSCTKRFTVAAPSQVAFNCGTDIRVPACSTQAQVTTAWNSFLSSTTASGGCNGVLTRTSATAPSTCGGYVDVTWTYTVSVCGQQSGCGSGATNSVSCTKRFTVEAAPAATLNCGNNMIVASCSTQAQVNAAWASFLASTTVSGGCSSGTLTNNAPTAPPATCGGYVDVTWTYRTNSTCGQPVTCGGQTSTTGTQTCTKRFTVEAATPATLSCATDVRVPSCSSQTQINATWASFLASTTVSGGCSTGTLTNNAPANPPTACGGYVDVTWTYRTNSTCGQPVTCGGQTSTTGTQTCTKRFTVEAPTPATLNCATDVRVPSCSSQAQINATWASFLASTTVSGGCTTGTLTNNAPANPPAACGGYVDVTWTYRTNSTCGQPVTCGGQTSTTGTQTCTKRFTVEAAPAVTFSCGTDKTVASCSTQAQVNCAWTAFLASTTVSGGCSTGTLTNNAPSTPPSTCGGYVDVTWTYRTNSTCGQPVTCGGQTSTTGTQTCTKRFTVEAAPAVTFNCGNNVCLPACSSQAQVNCAWNSFLASTTVSGGCSSGTLTNNAPSAAPSACGGYVDVTWTYRSNNTCGQTITCGGTTSQASVYTCTKRFTVTAGGGVDVSGPGSVSYPATNYCSQYAVNCAFANWLAQFTTVSSGCGATAVFSGDCRVAPSWANGGTVRVTYSITGNCNSDSVCASFTITRSSSCSKIAEGGVKTAMSVKAYPNPFSENFNLDLVTSTEDKVGVAIYDMTGKLIEQREVNAEEVSGLQVGDRFASGVYNVIVTQGTEVKTLRVIKR
ncbi:T9SS type A sorting domain-containing protein, partial [Flavobacterium paronense]